MKSTESLPARRHRPRYRLGVALLGLLLLPALLGGWKSISGETINPNLVKRIKDGQTTKQEILVFFGDPQEINRTPDGLVFTYKSFKDAPALPYKPEDRKIAEQSDSLYLIDENKQVKKPTIKKEGKILRSTLVVRFKPDEEIVLSHEYKEF